MSYIPPPPHSPAPWVLDQWVGDDDYIEPDLPFVQIGNIEWRPVSVEVPAALQEKIDGQYISSVPEMYRLLEEAYILIAGSEGDAKRPKDAWVADWKKLITNLGGYLQ